MASATATLKQEAHK